MIQIELFGCTSAGKSSLVKAVLQACHDQDINAVTDDEFVLKQVRLNWTKSRLVRTLLVDVLALFTCLLSWRRNREFYRLSIRTISHLPAVVGWFERLNLARNVLKKVGIYELVRRLGANQEGVVVIDEGTIQTAHCLFVHLSADVNLTEVSTFVGLVPLPDLAVYVTQSPSIMVERTLARGHKRIPVPSYASVDCFVRRAVDTFDLVARHVALKGRLLKVEPQQRIVANQEDQTGLLSARILEILRSETDRATVYAPTI
ncbi:MAG: hypothetical protein DMG06_13495 [Acidobacteria bacterium]|nr:MAG: hypothetical protein DMG06_13495 [Acidobacteriota bacterium]